jgi:hypothetical protein
MQSTLNGGGKGEVVKTAFFHAPINRKIFIILYRFSTSDCKPRTIQWEQRLKCTNDSEQIDPRGYIRQSSLLDDMYLIFSWVVSKLSQRLSSPKMEDLVTAI